MPSIRSGTPLLYRVIPVWFVKVQGSTEALVANNKATNWVPASVGENRFQPWLENARDWNVSRNRYWGTPLPLWANEDYSEVSQSNISIYVQLDTTLTLGTPETDRLY
jgi:isoleucyl-tRNA synthetase